MRMSKPGRASNLHSRFMSVDSNRTLRRFMSEGEGEANNFLLFLNMPNQFIRRLTAAVRWVNLNRQAQLWKLSTNQKERARHCLAGEPKGRM